MLLLSTLVRFNVAKSLELLMPHVPPALFEAMVKPVLLTLRKDADRDCQFYSLRALECLFFFSFLITYCKIFILHSLIMNTYIYFFNSGWPGNRLKSIWLQLFKINMAAPPRLSYECNFSFAILVSLYFFSPI